MKNIRCRVMKAMYDNGVPVPRPIVLCEDERYRKHSFLGKVKLFVVRQGKMIK